MAELTLDSILNPLYLVWVVVFIGYEQRIQATVMLVNVRCKLVKMSSKETISGMTSEIIKAVDEASGNVRAIIVTETNPRDTIILAGIKNTIGIE